MDIFAEKIKVLDKRFGNGKDNVISLATISSELSMEGLPRPCVRDVNAFYENGVFYVTTHTLSNKLKQIALNSEVSFSINFEAFSGYAVGKDLGCVLEPKNAELRTKARSVFAEWYDEANQEDVTSILAIEITKASLVEGHGATRRVYEMDFINKTVI